MLGMTNSTQTKRQPYRAVKLGGFWGVARPGYPPVSRHHRTQDGAVAEAVHLNDLAKRATA